MGMQNPTPNVTTGPEYATDVTAALNIIDAHTHTGASNNDGKQIPSAGLNINADLSAQSNNFTTLRSIRFSNQSLVLSGIGDVGCIYEKSGDLWYNNASGTPVQITSGASLIAPVGGYTTTTTTSNLTINSTATTIIVAADSTSNTITVTLPLANAVAAGRFYIIKDVKGTSGSNAITITPSGSNAIDGVTGSIVIRNNFGAQCLVSNGANGWLLLSYDSFPTPIQSSATTITIPSSLSDEIYLINVTSNAVSVALPALSAARSGIRVLVKDSGAASITGNAITVTPNGSDKIEGLNAAKKITTAYGQIWLLATSSGWIMI